MSSAAQRTARMYRILNGETDGEEPVGSSPQTSAEPWRRETISERAERIATMAQRLEHGD